MLGSLISGGLSLLSGLFGRSSAQKRAAQEAAAIRQLNEQATANAAAMNDYVRKKAAAAAKVPIVTKSVGKGNLAALVADAEAHGFNPLTVLRSGGQQFYAENTSTTTGSTAMEAALAGTQLPALSAVIPQTQVPGIGEVIGNALSSFGSQWLSERTAAQNQANQMELINAQLKGAQTPGSYKGPRSFSVPSMTSSGGSGYVPGGGVKGGGGKLRMGGYNVPTDPDTSDMNDFENRYGDSLVSEFLSWGVAANDVKQIIQTDPGGFAKAMFMGSAWLFPSASGGVVGPTLARSGVNVRRVITPGASAEQRPSGFSAMWEDAQRAFAW